MKKLFKIFLIGLIAIIVFQDCGGKGDDTTKKDLLGTLYIASINRTDADYGLCASAIAVMNQCIASNAGYSYTYMCNAAKIQAVKASLASITKYGGLTVTTNVAKGPTDTAAPTTSGEVWTGIIKCLSAKVNTSYCNLDQNKLVDAKTADAAGPAFGTSCDVYATSVTAGVTTTPRSNAIDPAQRAAIGK